MASILATVRKYPFVVVTLLIAALAALLTVTPWRGGSQWLLAGFALLMACRSAWTMARELRAGTFGIDILAVTAIVASVLVGEYWAAIVIVLMLTGGEALEDYAANRAKRDLTTLLSRAPQFGHRLARDGSTQDGMRQAPECLDSGHISVRLRELL